MVKKITSIELPFGLEDALKRRIQELYQDVLDKLPENTSPVIAYSNIGSTFMAEVTFYFSNSSSCAQFEYRKGSWYMTHDWND